MTEPTRERIIKELLHIAENSRSKGEVCRAAAEMLMSDKCGIERLTMTNDVLETDNYNLEMNLTHITEELERLQEKNRWISVEEKLPETISDVIIYFDRCGGEIGRGWYGKIYNAWVMNNGFKCCYNVTHWQHLPDAPESEESK